jgi:hypothetical protein
LKSLRNGFAPDQESEIFKAARPNDMGVRGFWFLLEALQQPIPHAERIMRPEETDKAKAAFTGRLAA